MCQILTTIILPSEVITATVPDNWIKESILQGMQTENLEYGREIIWLTRKKVTELRYNYSTKPLHSQHKNLEFLSSILYDNYTINKRKKQRKKIPFCMWSISLFLIMQGIIRHLAHSCLFVSTSLESFPSHLCKSLLSLRAQHKSIRFHELSSKLSHISRHRSICNLCHTSGTFIYCLQISLYWACHVSV